MTVSVPTDVEFAAVSERVTALEATAPVPGPQGDTGPAGPVGPAGPTGASGSTSLPGVVAVDSFTGSDDQRLQAALAVFDGVSGQKPVIALANRTYTFAGQYNLRPGLQLLGPGVEREFSANCVVRVTHAAGLFVVPAAGVRGVFIRGICFTGSGTNAFIQDVVDLGSGPLISDMTITDCGWVGFRSVMRARHLRCKIERTYCNGGKGTQFALAGSDNDYWSDGGAFLSSTTMPVGSWYLDFVHMSQTNIGPLYITTQGAGVRVQNSYGALTFNGTRLDGTGRTAAQACQTASLLIAGGKGVKLRDVWAFNGAVSATARGQIEITGGSGHQVLGLSTANAFGGFAASTPVTRPAVYSTVPVYVDHVGSDNVQSAAVIAPA